jgi:hypothetical protein
MKYFITLAVFCTLLSACDMAVSPQIAGAGDGGVISGGGGGGGTNTDALKVVPSTIDLVAGTHVTLTTNAPATPVSWKSDAPAVASVTSEGVATANAVGVARITATTQSGTTRSASATITVRAQ